MRSGLKAGVILVILVGLVVLYQLYFRNTEARGEAPSVPEEDVKVQPVPVRVAQAFVGTLVQYVNASGVTESRRSATIRAQVSGVVRQVPVFEGQQVRAGQVLLKIDDEPYQVAFNQARSTLLQAQTEFLMAREADRPGPLPDSTRQRLNRMEKQYQQLQRRLAAGEISTQHFLEFQRKYLAALILSGEMQQELMAQKSGLAQAEAAYLKAQLDLQHCTVTAPYPGIVANLHVHVGDFVSNGGELMQLVDLRHLRLKLQVLEADLAQISPGQDIQAHFSAFPDTTFAGRIVGVDPVIDPESHTGTVVAELDNSAGLLKAGMFATAMIAVRRYPHRLLVPREAVIERDQRKLLFIVRNGRSVWCYVDTGLENQKYVEITSSEFNLKPGEPVIVEGQFALAHDAPVRIVQAVTQ